MGSYNPPCAERVAGFLTGRFEIRQSKGGIGWAKGGNRGLPSGGEIGVRGEKGRLAQSMFK